ncbi:hypothetical protein DPM33_23295 [Mesorhizobium hawassense]|uniref:HEAT repeat domain-containing protein n=1 Tax=Mesorhizobium hawassense TaxID=1209954 RepID=A0A330HL94_9HYPH|nr:hypothetical protein [Mesorhizobium hawassense]RAZ88458.1 hypothetical protein DPM33_23295 [Mesorhizobium hawassense]
MNKRATLVYEGVKELDRSRTYKSLLSGETGEQIRAILTISWHDDWRFAQDVCFKYARHTDYSVRNIAIVGIGHIARIHGAIEIGSVLALLADLRHLGHHHGSVEDMLSDIMVYVARQGRREI